MAPTSRPPPPRGTLGPVARGLYRAGIGAVLLALVLLALDLLAGVQLPQPVRPALPFVLMAGLALALALGVGAYGAPRRPERQPPEGQTNDRPAPE